MTYTNDAARIADAIAAHENAVQPWSVTTRRTANAYAERSYMRIEWRDGWTLELAISDYNPADCSVSVITPNYWEIVGGIGSTAEQAITDAYACAVECLSADANNESMRKAVKLLEVARSIID